MRAMTKSLTALLGGLAFAAATGTAIAQETPPPGGEPKDFQLAEAIAYQLANGLGVTMVPYGKVPKAAVRLVIRTGNIDEEVPGLQFIHQCRRTSDRLDEQCDGSGIGVCGGDGQRNSLAVGRDAHDHELAGLVFLRDLRCLDDDSSHVRCDRLRFQDQVHRPLRNNTLSDRSPSR